MQFLLKFKLSDHLYLRDPEKSELGKAIIRNAIDLIDDIGFERFTFKKLAQKIESTETTIYRYFSSKHKLLTYILNWYWNYLEFVAKMRMQQITDATAKLKLLLEIITHNDVNSYEMQEYDLKKLHSIVISESSKSYLVKEVDEINKELVFNPLKSLCQCIGEVISEINPNFSYPKSLASTLMETAHDQQFFSEHLPKLTDNRSNTSHKAYVLAYLNVLAFSVIK
ncbi:TetR/AcrR family transcriptional regulator [Pedobacter chitinilyticus]|nr:TetR/AcrR family transcriptional regulator [Pedobacter chitinilyticus]